MLTSAQSHPQAANARVPRGQRGISLLVALIVLIAMTLSAIGLMRSVFTSNRIAGNLSFQQAATQAADVGIETAVAWLEENAADPALFNHIDPAPGRFGYWATRADPAANESWEQFWNRVLVPGGRVNTLAPDAAGNTVAFAIQRLCASEGDPRTGIGCSLSPLELGSEGNSRGSGAVGLLAPSQRYYRITTRVAGPRNTVGFVQAIVAM